MLLIIDYMQKVPQFPEPSSESEKVTYVVNGLKDIALSEKVPTIAIVAADKEGLKAARLRNHHLRGSSAINYEADIILILNEKYQIVAKVNIEFNPYQAQRFRDWVVVSIEKNRSGADNVDTEFHKHFDFSCFDPTGSPGAGEADRGAAVQRLARRRGADAGPGHRRRGVRRAGDGRARWSTPATACGSSRATRSRAARCSRSSASRSSPATPESAR